MEIMEKKNKEIFNFLWKQRKLILIVAGLAASISFLFTIIMPQKYKSVSRVYPANLQMFSGESPTEQLLQWLKSEEIMKLFMNNKKFDLLTHYNIDPNDISKDDNFNAMFEERFGAKLTDFQSLELSVIDEDAHKAQQLNSAYIEFADSLIRIAHDEKILEFTKMLDFSMKRQLNIIDSLKNILFSMASQYDITDYKIQLKEANKNYLKLLGKGVESKELKTLLDNLGQKGPDQYIIVRMIEMEIDHYNSFKADYETKIKDLNKYFTYSVIVQRPNLPDTKFWPKKIIIIPVAVLSSVFLLIITLLFLEKIKKEFY